MRSWLIGFGRNVHNYGLWCADLFEVMAGEYRHVVGCTGSADREEALRLAGRFEEVLPRGEMVVWEIDDDPPSHPLHGWKHATAADAYRAKDESDRRGAVRRKARKEASRG